MRRTVVTVAVLALLLAALVFWLNRRGEAPIAPDAAPHTAAPPEQIARGAYLARAGNCMGCHTAPGGAAYAGGRGIATPFGTVYAPNLTPDAGTGIGRWSAAHFWRALHHGRSFDGRSLYPAFPYPSYTHLTREDSDALYAHLCSQPPVAQTNQPHALRFPYNSQPALAVWRALFFSPGPATPMRDDSRSAEWNRGAYLVQALGHCGACHSTRNAWGATPGPGDLGGGLIPMQNWYAPSLTSPREAGVAGWDTAQVVALLKNGMAVGPSGGAWATGPMAQVVFNSTQHLTDADLRAVAIYLQALPQTTPERPRAQAVDAAQATHGAALYDKHCAECHGAQGEGAPGAYPALANNRAVLIDPPANLVRTVLQGGFAPVTAGNPRPFGMPPYATVLSNDDIAAVLTHLRTAWGHTAAPVSALEVSRYRR